MKRIDALVQAAIDFVAQRFPTGVEGAAAMYLDDGEIVVSTSPICVNESVALCHETGAICEAYKRNRKIVATVCVSREETGEYYILTPCGVCQERLWAWGGDIDCVIPQAHDPKKWTAVKLSALSPHYWRKPFIDEK